jgi:large subunit ribosomal protein L9
MQIILLESLSKLGKAGDVVSVKNGFANNFLIPQKKAIVANKKNKTELENRMTEINTNNQIKIDEANKLKSEIEGKSIQLFMESNDDGNLYGSITQKQIVDGLKDQKIDISADTVMLNPIKSIGEFEISIRLYEDIESKLKVIISNKK